MLYVKNEDITWIDDPMWEYPTERKIKASEDDYKTCQNTFADDLDVEWVDPYFLISKPDADPRFFGHYLLTFLYMSGIWIENFYGTIPKFIYETVCIADLSGRISREFQVEYKSIHKACKELLDNSYRIEVFRNTHDYLHAVKYYLDGNSKSYIEKEKEFWRNFHAGKYTYKEGDVEVYESFDGSVSRKSGNWSEF